jgi:ATP-dependent DNA helicase DinG
LQGPLQELQARIDESAVALETVAPCGAGVERCWRRAQDLRQCLTFFSAAAVADNDPDEGQQAVLWYEARPRGFALHRTPISIADLFGATITKRRCAWVFTSATLAVGNGFQHFTEPLGLVDARELKLDSPFDFQQQALLYLPANLPDPNSPSYMPRLLDAAIPVIEACGGRTFLLVTSYRALNEAALRLQVELSYPVLVQGSFPRGELLQRFKSLGNAVLIGTNSFWEGVDVRGEALSCVIIDRLPFSAPGDPVLEARLESLRSAGKNPFMDYQLPRAVISLKQGVGRLIRDPEDRGLLMLCDPRLLNKSYGRVFLKSLPPMPQTRRLTEVETFMQQNLTAQLSEIP